MFSVSAANTVWVEQGVNSLVLPTAKEDEGWKKIKRVKVRFELFQRLNDTVEVLIGRINNDPDGRMTVIQVSNGVCQTMVAEKKLLEGRMWNLTRIIRQRVTAHGSWYTQMTLMHWKKCIMHLSSGLPRKILNKGGVNKWMD